MTEECRSGIFIRRFWKNKKEIFQAVRAVWNISFDFIFGIEGMYYSMIPAIFASSLMESLETILP